MARVKTAMITRKKHKKILKRAKGYYGAKHYRFRNAKQAVMKSGMYAYIGRKDKKSDFRKLWITRINAGCRENDISYSKFINGLNIAGITVNRKMLSELAIDDAKAFSDLVNVAKEALKSGKKPEVKETKQASKPVEEKKTTEKAETKEEKKDYSKMTLAELKAVAKEQGVKGYSTMKKEELLSNIK